MSTFQPEDDPRAVMATLLILSFFCALLRLIAQ